MKVPATLPYFSENDINYILENFRKILKGDSFLSMSVHGESFEQLFSSFIGTKYGVACNSGTSALELICLSIDVDGKEVILPSNTFLATAIAIIRAGGTPVFADCGNNMCLSSESVAKNITKKTAAVIIVHIGGIVSESTIKIQEICRQNDIPLIEDAAQAIGSKNNNMFLGTQSDIGCFSLSVAKTIGTGQGGFVVTNNTELAKRMKNMRTHGVENVRDPKKWNYLGFNFRYTDIMASLGIEQLKKLPMRLNQAKIVYKLYEKELDNSPFKIIDVNLPNGEVPVYNEFLVDNREQWINLLNERGVETRPFYPCIHKAKYLNVKKTSFKHSQKYEQNGIYLPSGPGQTLDSIDSVIRCIKEIA